MHTKTKSDLLIVSSFLNLHRTFYGLPIPPLRLAETIVPAKNDDILILRLITFSTPSVSPPLKTTAPLRRQLPWPL